MLFFMLEITFIAEDDVDGGYTARALEASIFTEADTFENLKAAVRDAVHCHFDDADCLQRVIRLRYVREDVFNA
jgi:hypothetical protein